MHHHIKRVDETLFDVPTLALARLLLGCLLVKEYKEAISEGFVVETEAYIGPEDRATHSYGNRRTKRTEVMSRRVGLAYTYTMHTMFNQCRQWENRST